MWRSCFDVDSEECQLPKPCAGPRTGAVIPSPLRRSKFFGWIFKIGSQSIFQINRRDLELSFNLSGASTSSKEEVGFSLQALGHEPGVSEP